MNFRIRFPSLILLIFLVMPTLQTFSQCLQIETILVDACDDSGDEGFNEMAVFRTGPLPTNTAIANVNWPSQSWQGFAQNAVTASKVATLNAQIAALGGCGRLLEPTAGLIPPFSKVILITSQNFSLTANAFGALTSDVYILFQDNTTVTGGHFGNYSPTPGIRTLTITFGGCTDSVSYDRSQLVDASGLPGASNGATVNFTDAGAATYTNQGCIAPIDVFTVDAGNPQSACPGATIMPAATAQGQASVSWTASSGSFSNDTALNSNYTLPLTGSGSVTLTLTATNSCGNIISDTVLITISAGTTPNFNPVTPICAGDPLVALPSTSLNGIVGTWSPALDNTQNGTYTFAPNNGQCASNATLTITVNPLRIPSFDPVTPICSGNILAPLPNVSLEGITGNWSPALNNTQSTTYTFFPNPGQCAATNNLTIVVTNGAVPTFIPVAGICVGDALSLPLVSLNGISGTWSPTPNNAQTTTYTFTPNPGQCATTNTLIVTVNAAGTVPTFNAVNPICSGESIMPLPLISLNGITGTWSPALDNTQTKTYNFIPTAGQCANPTILTITVNQKTTPTFNPVVAICTGSALAPLPTVSMNGITGNWLPALDNTETKTYIFTPNPGQCASMTTLTITVNQKATPDFATALSVCFGGNVPVLTSTSPNGISGVWLPTTISNTISNINVFTPTAGQCANMTSLIVTVGANPVLQETGYICFDSTGLLVSPATIDTGLTMAEYTFSWTRDGSPLATTASSLQGTQVGIYTVTATNNTTLCTITTISTIASSPPANASAYVNEDFADVQQIIVKTSGGSGNFLYQLDNGAWQQSPVFYITEGGDYTVHVNDVSGCSSFVLQVTALNFPKFFTPNADGYNDFWNVDGLLSSQEGIVTIFDRYGKLLKQISAAGAGWDGIYNGKALPSTDYWFLITYRNASGQSKTFQSHFSLKR